MPAQPRHLAVVELDEAISSALDALDLYRATSAFPQVPPMSGGVLDWPRAAREALAICRSEDDAVTRYMQAEEAFRG